MIPGSSISSARSILRQPDAHLLFAPQRLPTDHRKESSRLGPRADMGVGLAQRIGQTIERVRVHTGHRHITSSSFFPSGAVSSFACSGTPYPSVRLLARALHHAGLPSSRPRFSVPAGRR
jgi:hypothetical protein